MDLLSLLYTGILALGVFSADAWFHSDVIHLKLTMPKGLGASEASIGDTLAENIFLTEVADIDAVPTFVVKPRVRSSNEATVVSMVGDLLGLQKFTLLVQRATGVEPIEVSGALTKRGDRHQLVLVSNAEAPPAQRLALTVEGAPGEPVPQLIRRGAAEAMLSYEDYLVCLHLVMKAGQGALAPYEPGFEKPGAEGLDLLIGKRMALRPTGIALLGTAADQAARRDAMFSNLRGVLALETGDVSRADRMFDLSLKARPDFAIAGLNRAFVQIHRDRYQDAVDIVRALVDAKAVHEDPILTASAYVTWGVAAWGLHHTEEAARLFAKAAEAYPRSTMAYVYWGDMLESLGDTAGAEDKRKKAAENLPYFENYAETAILHFRLSPTDNAPLTRL